MRKFKSIENIRDASLEELAETESMNAGSAQKVYEFFHGASVPTSYCFKNQLVGTLVRKKYKICKNIPGFFYILPKDSRFL